jgi:hypothetical protein
MQELVVPKSIPKTFAIFSAPICSVTHPLNGAFKSAVNIPRAVIRPQLTVQTDITY